MKVWQKRRMCSSSQRGSSVHYIMSVSSPVTCFYFRRQEIQIHNGISVKFTCLVKCGTRSHSMQLVMWTFQLVFCLYVQISWFILDMLIQNDETFSEVFIVASLCPSVADIFNPMNYSPYLLVFFLTFLSQRRCEKKLVTCALLMHIITETLLPWD